MRKKLIYIIPSLGVGGAELALLSAIPELNRRFDFRVICLSSFSLNFLGGLSEEECSNILTFKRFPFNYFRALCYSLKFNPDIIITSLWKAAPLGVIAKLFMSKIKYIEFIHSSIYFHFFDKIFTKLAIKCSDVVFCDSVSAKTFVEKENFFKPIEVISFLRFHSPKQWHPKSHISLKALFLGRFHEQKRIDRLVLLVKKLKDSGLYFQVDLYGRDDGVMGFAKNLIKENNLESNIFLKGEVTSDKVQCLFTNYDFYFQTSDVEGMAMSVVEAMQHGLICVVTNVGEIRNYAKNGINAIVIRDDFDFSITVNQLINIANDIDLANKISRNAHLTFVDNKDFANSLIENLIKCV